MNKNRKRTAIGFGTVVLVCVAATGCMTQAEFKDVDGDGYQWPEDCDDSNGSVYPGALEIPGNGVDDNCDDVPDENTLENDMDGDGFSENTGDCNDEDSTIHPGAGEICNNVDDDCDAEIDEEIPGVDGPCMVSDPAVAQGSCANGKLLCEAGALACVPSEAADVDLCNGLDDDCDGQIDEEDLNDPLIGDECTAPGLGQCQFGTIQCNVEAGDYYCHTATAIDETCDGTDQDCDGIVDDGCECVPGTVQSCGTDIGECSSGVLTCGLDGTWPDEMEDCSSDSWPEAEECNLLDDDCDGVTDNNISTIGAACVVPDAIGLCAEGVWECNDGTQTCEPLTTPLPYDPCDGIDNDCDGTLDESSSGVAGSNCQACIDVGNINLFPLELTSGDAEFDGEGAGPDVMLTVDIEITESVLTVTASVVMTEIHSCDPASVGDTIANAEVASNYIATDLGYTGFYGLGDYTATEAHFEYNYCDDGPTGGWDIVPAGTGHAAYVMGGQCMADTEDVDVCLELVQCSSCDVYLGCIPVYYKP